MKTIKILRRIQRLANCISKRRRFGDEHRKTFGVITTDLTQGFQWKSSSSFFICQTNLDRSNQNQLNLSYSTWNDNRIRHLTWSFVIDGRRWTADEHGPSTSYTNSDDGPLKIWKCGRRWTGGQMDENPQLCYLKHVIILTLNRAHIIWVYDIFYVKRNKMN